MPQVATKEKEQPSRQPSRVDRILDRHKKMKAEKTNWLPLYQLCAEYIMTRKQGFTVEAVPGMMQTEHIFDDTAPNANSLMAAALIGALWPNGAKSFRIGMPHGMEDELGWETEEIKLYYQKVTTRMAEYMDNPKAGFKTALEEYMLDQGAFGISGIMIEENEDDFEVPLAYRAVDAKALHIAEGKNGFVNVVYIEREYTVLQVVEEYGMENVSASTRKKFMQGDQSAKVMILQAIEPRMERNPYGFGNKNMPIGSIHIEVKESKILKESGFLEMPIAITRFWKAMGEVYGRSPGMQAMPSILEANALGEAWTLAVEKTLDPSLLVLDDGTMGSGVIDTSPGGITVCNISGRIGASTLPIQPLFLVGDLNWTAARRTELNEVIKNHFFVDRLMDLNNEQRMTLGEANIRNGLRGQTLNPVYSRQFAELFVPIIEATFNKLRRRGLLGVVPGSQQELELLERGYIPFYIPEPVLNRMVSGQEVYKIEFISEAARIMHSQELSGIDQLLLTVTTVAAAQPSVLDNVDWDWTMRRVQELGGAPRETIVSMERLKKMRAERAAAFEAQAKAEEARNQSEVARNFGQAAASVSSTKEKAA